MHGLLIALVAFFTLFLLLFHPYFFFRFLAAAFGRRFFFFLNNSLLFGFGWLFIAAFHNGLFGRIGGRSFYNALAFGLAFVTTLLGAGCNSLFIKNLVNQCLFIKFFGVGDFQLFCDVKQLRNEHIVQLQNVVHKGVLN